MLRTSLLAVTLSLTACGIDPAVPAVQEAPLAAATPTSRPGTERLEFTQLTPRLRPVTSLQPALDVVSVHSLAAADGTEVRYLLGMMGCGISVVARGSATVQGGAFEIPYDSTLSEFGQMSLFFQVGGGVCDPETSQVFEVATTLPGIVDLSTLPEQSFAGCWLFEE
ncbi:MAG: hypothetical protein Q8L48_39645 [Archangium sp.]|nr:hypothetical protein [Archangium sp.]